MRYISRIMQEINQLLDKETKQKMHAIYLAESWQEINHQVDKETKQSKKMHADIRRKIGRVSTSKGIKNKSRKRQAIIGRK